MIQWHNYEVHAQIIPTVLIPLTALSVAISSIAVFIAGLFGIKLKADGPKKILEVLLKPKVLLSAALLNLGCWGAYNGFIWLKNASTFDAISEWKQNHIAQPSNRIYSDVLQQTFKNKPDTLLKLNTHKNIHSAENKIEYQLDVKWKLKLPKGSFSEPTISGGSLFIASDDGYIYEVDLATGEQLRQFFVGKAVTPKVIIYKGYMYAGEGTHDTHHARISKFNLANGKFIGSFRTLGHIEGQMWLDVTSDVQPLLFSPGGKGGLYAINPITMAQVWNTKIGHNDGGVTVDNNVVYFGTGREKNVVDEYRSWAVAVNKSNGQILWKRELPASSWMPPLLHTNQVCFVFGEVYFKSEVGGLTCFDKTTGQSLNTYFHTAPIAADPIIFNNDFIINDLNGKTCRINSLTMRPKWCQEELDNDYTLAGIKYDTFSSSLIKSTRRAEIVMLDPETGKERLRWKPISENKLSSFASVAVVENNWWFIDLDGNLTHLKLH